MTGHGVSVPKISLGKGLSLGDQNAHGFFKATPQFAKKLKLYRSLVYYFVCFNISILFAGASVDSLQCRVLYVRCVTMPVHDPI